MNLVPEDERMLRELLALVTNDDDEDNAGFNVSAFRGMLSRGKALTPAQRKWVGDVYEKLVGEPVYENLASSGKLCRGREVETPALLRRENLPLKPPKRLT